VKTTDEPWGPDDTPWCSDCEATELTWVHCETCEDGLDGHDCGEDSCCCLHPEENVACGICHGRGGWWTCATCNERERDAELVRGAPEEGR